MTQKKFQEIAKEVVTYEINALKILKSSIGSSFNNIVKTITNCKNGKIIISGVGKSGIIGKNGLQLFHQLEHHHFF